MSDKIAIEANRIHYEAAYSRRLKILSKWRMFFSFDQQYKHKINWHLIKKWVEIYKVTRVLDVGFGYGLNLKKFNKRVILCGTEMSQSAVKSFKHVCEIEGRKSLLCVNDSFNSLPFNTKFDVIICSHVLEHISDDINLLSEFHRLLSPHGALVLNIPINEIMHDPKHIHRYNIESIHSMLCHTNFIIIDEVTSDRWEAFFNWCKNQGISIPLKYLRALLCIFPYQWLEWIGNHILYKFPHQQLAILASLGNNAK